MPDRIAIDLLRVARDPVTGWLPHRSALEVALRAALFAELALDGHLVDRDNAPSAPIAEPTGDRVFDAVCRTVHGREDVVWRRWFRYVSGDRTTLCAELVTAERWARTARWRIAFTDTESEQAQALAFELNRIAKFDRSARDSREAILALLGVSCGAIGRRPHPAAVHHELKSVLDGIENATAAKVVSTAAVVIRQRRRGLRAIR